MFRKVHQAMKPDVKKPNPWDDANMLQNVKNEGVHVTTVANQRYVYRECPSRRLERNLTAHSWDDSAL